MHHSLLWSNLNQVSYSRLPSVDKCKGLILVVLKIKAKYHNFICDSSKATTNFIFILFYIFLFLRSRTQRLVCLRENILFVFSAVYQSHLLITDPKSVLPVNAGSFFFSWCGQETFFWEFWVQSDFIINFFGQCPVNYFITVLLHSLTHSPLHLPTSISKL